MRIIRPIILGVIEPMLPKPVDMLTNPTDQPASFGPCGQTIDNIKSNVINSIAHTYWLFVNYLHRLSNKDYLILIIKDEDLCLGAIGQLTC